MSERNSVLPLTDIVKHTELCKLQRAIEKEINNENRVKLQRLINDATVLVFRRIIQLTKVPISDDHFFKRSCGFYKTSTDKVLEGEKEITKACIAKKVQEVMDELDRCLKFDMKVFYPAQTRDVVRMEEFIASSVREGVVPEVSTDEIVSRFLWIAYTKYRNITIDEINERSYLLTFDRFKSLVREHGGAGSIGYKWKGYVMDAALLGKSKAEIERGIPLSMCMNGYSISGRTIKYLEEHTEITIKEIKETLQRALDIICFVDKGNGSNIHIVRSREARWFCELFDRDKGNILIDKPKLNTPQALLFECVKRKTIYEDSCPKTSFKESVLEGKSIICYDATLRVNGHENIPIFVSRGATTCHRHGHIIANVTALVKVADRSERVAIPIQKCLTCKPNRFFVSDTVLEKFERQYGYMYFRRIDDLELYFQDPQSWLNYCGESLLHKLGYNVSESNGLSESQRHAVLISIINKHQMTKSDIMRHIDMLIRQHHDDDKYVRAVAKWRSDLQWLATLKDTMECYNGYLYR